MYGLTKSSSAPISDASNEAINGMAWLRGEAASQGFNSVNYQSMGMIPLMQQRFDPVGSRNDLSQQYQAMVAGGLQNFGSSELLKNQFLQFQQPLHYNQPQHGPHSSVSPHMLPTQTQMLSGNLQRPLEQQIEGQAEKRAQEQNYQEAYFAAQHDQLQQRPMFDIQSSSISKPEFSTSNHKFPASMAHPTMQNLLSPDGSSNLLDFSRIGEPILNEHSPQQSWISKFTESTANGSKTVGPFSGKDASVEVESCSMDVQNQALFGANIGSSALLIPTSASVVGTVHADIQSGPSGYQNPLYGCVEDSSDVLQTTDARNFVKVIIKNSAFVTAGASSK